MEDSMPLADLDFLTGSSRDSESRATTCLQLWKHYQRFY